ncbi:MAG: carbonate dehydratase [Deltaproteobacteria bacterium]
MNKLPDLFANNRDWAFSIKQNQPDFFKTLARQQSPDYLWIGCSDSRVPANEIVGLMPGELFVHRNVANLIVHSDMNCLSVIQYAIEVLNVKHIVVCGHYGCGGVIASLEEKRHGLIDNWLGYIRDIYLRHQDELKRCKSRDSLTNRLCELNVVRQVYNVCCTTMVQDAWARNRKVTVHGWIYGIEDGLLRDLNVCVAGKKDYMRIFKKQP